MVKCNYLIAFESSLLKGSKQHFTFKKSVTKLVSTLKYTRISATQTQMRTTVCRVFVSMCVKAALPKSNKKYFRLSLEKKSRVVRERRETHKVKAAYRCELKGKRMRQIRAYISIYMIGFRHGK